MDAYLVFILRCKDKNFPALFFLLDVKNDENVCNERTEHLLRGVVALHSGGRAIPNSF
jgi:hypothetical protein